MLDGLEKINWNELEQAYGSAEDIPKHIRSLTSADASERKDGQYWLTASICHQGTLYTASAAAAPFLIELAVSPEVTDRAWIIRFLASLAVSDPDRWLAPGFDIDSPRMADYFDGEEGAAFLASYEAVQEGVDQLLGLLEDGDAQVRAAAAMAVAWFPRRAAEIRKGVLAALARESDPVVTASLLVCAALQDQYADATVALDVVRARLDAAAPVGVVAAHALMRYPESPDLDTAVATARNYLLSDAAVQRVEGFPWVNGDVAGFAFDAIEARVGARDRVITETLFSLVERVADDSDDARVALARKALRPLFWLCTNNPAPEGGWTAESIPADLRRFATAVVERPFLGEPALYNGLEENGLPGDLEPLRALLGVVRPPSPLDVELAVAGRTRTARQWADALREGAGGPALRMDYGTMVAELQPGPGGDVEPSDDSRAAAAAIGQLGAEGIRVAYALAAEEGAALAALIPAVDAAVAADAAGALSAAEELAVARRDAGPPVRYSRAGTQIVKPALVLLVAAGSRASEALGVPPPEALDRMTLAGLGAEVFLPEIERYFDKVPTERRARFFADLAEADFQSGWKVDPFKIRIEGRLFELVVGWLADGPRRELLRARADFWDEHRSLFERYFSLEELISAVIPLVTSNLTSMETWAKDEMAETIEQEAQRLAALGPAARDRLQAAATDPELPYREVFARAVALLDADSDVDADAT